MRFCPQCTCTDDNACLTSMGPCFWLAGSDLCSACLFPAIRLSGPQIEEVRTIAPESPLTLVDLCQTARHGDADGTRWFWAVYGKERGRRLEAAIRFHAHCAA